jgi:hypothetical protein
MTSIVRPLTQKRHVMKSLLILVFPAWAFAAQPALTIYNQNFAVIRESVPLELKEGVTDVKFTGVTAHLEPQSVILRDPSGKTQLQILEQRFRNDPVSERMMLSLFEGQQIDFLVTEPQKPDRIVKGSGDPKWLHAPPPHGNRPVGLSLPTADRSSCGKCRADHRGGRTTSISFARNTNFPGCYRPGHPQAGIKLATPIQHVRNTRR